MDSSWVGEVLSLLSPQVAKMATGSLKRELESVVEITKMELGEKRPVITNMKVHKEQYEEALKIVIDFDLEYLGDSNIEVSVMGTYSSVRDVHVEGKVRVILTPIMKCLPLVGGIQFFFRTIPFIGFDLEGLADIADHGFMKKKIKKSIQNGLVKRFVYPERMVVPISQSCDYPALIYCSNIIGGTT